MVDIFNGRVPGWAGVASGQCTPGYTLVPATPAPRLFSAHPGAGAKNRAPTGLMEQPLVFQRSSLRSFLFSGLPKRKAAPRSASCSPVLLSFPPPEVPYRGGREESSAPTGLFRVGLCLSHRRGAAAFIAAYVFFFLSICLSYPSEKSRLEVVRAALVSLGVI